MQEDSNETKQEFEYGWCYTDHKDGKQIRRSFRSIDYMKDEPYAASARKLLEKMGLPFPDDDQIFRGTHHDLLFLNSHNVVIRIGPTNVSDLVNPAIVQPLGWFDDNENNFTVAVYPGIELMEGQHNYKKLTDKLYRILRQTGQDTGDVRPPNAGIIRIQENGREKVVPVLLDPDNEWNGSKSNNISSIKQSIFSASKERNISDNEELIQKTMTAAYEIKASIADWKKAFDVHQPLRTLFWYACKDRISPDDMPNMKSMQAFWNKCAEVSKDFVPEDKLTVKQSSIRILEKIYDVFPQVERDLKNIKKLIDKVVEKIRGFIHQQTKPPPQKMDQQEGYAQPIALYRPWAKPNKQAPKTLQKNTLKDSWSKSATHKPNPATLASSGRPAVASSQQKATSSQTQSDKNSLYHRKKSPN